MSLLVGLLAKQVMRQSLASPEAGMKKYQALFIHTNEYADVKSAVDRLLVRCGYGEIVSDKDGGSAQTARQH